MKVGIVGGTGSAGKALGTRLAAGGADVLIGSRAIERAEEAAHHGVKFDLAGFYLGDDFGVRSLEARVLRMHADG